MRTYAQATRQPKVELFAEGENEYFLKAVDAQISFEIDDAGVVNQLVLHQSGRNTPAKRI